MGSSSVPEVRTLKEMLEDGSMDASDLPDPSWLDQVELISAQEAVTFTKLGLNVKHWCVREKESRRCWPSTSHLHGVMGVMESYEILDWSLATRDCDVLILWLLK